MDYQIKQGFLGQEFTHQYKQIRRKHKDFLSLAKKLNSLGHKKLYEIDIKKAKQNHQKYLSFLLFLRNMETFQGIVILAEKGMISQMSMLIRCMIDSTCELVNSCKNGKFPEEFELSNKIDKLDMLKLEKKYCNSHIKNVDYEIKELQSETKNIKRLTSIKLIENTCEIIKDQDLLCIFVRAFSLLSKTVHSTIIDLGENYFEIKNNEFFFKYGPRDKGIEGLLMTSMYFMKIIIEQIDELFGLPTDDDLKTLYNEIY